MKSPSSDTLSNCVKCDIFFVGPKFKTPYLLDKHYKKFVLLLQIIPVYSLVRLLMIKDDVTTKLAFNIYTYKPKINFEVSCM